VLDRGNENMMNKWIITTLITTMLGLILMLVSFMEIRKISKKLNQMDETEIVPENLMLSLVKNQKLEVLGISITAISEIIRVFLR
jgi:Na+/melibiose symporter-like transporter